MEKHIVRISEEHREDQMEIRNWLWENCEPGTYEELYKHWNPADGRWRSAPESKIVYVEFDNDTDAAAFKLAWS